MDREAKEAEILRLLDIYPTAERVSDEAYHAMVDEVEPYSVDAVARACRRFRAGEVEGHNNAFPPNAAQLAAEVRKLDVPAMAPPPLQGITEVNFGHGTIRTGHLTSAEVDFVFHHKGMLPDGRNMALLMSEDLKAEVAKPALALPPPEPKRLADIVPHLQRMAAE